MYRKNNIGGQYDGNRIGGSVDSAVETENDRLTDELKDKIKMIKSITIDIGREVKDQNQFLHNMDDEFDNAGGFLGNAMHRVKKLSKGSQNYVILYLFLFSALVFFILWILIKF